MNTEIHLPRLCGSRRHACELVAATPKPFTPVVELHCRELAAMSWSYADELIRDIATLAPNRLLVYGAGDTAWRDLEVALSRINTPGCEMRRIQTTADEQEATT